jgi:hypothetical protein
MASSSKFTCLYAGCNSSYVRSVELTRHCRDHDFKEGRVNPYACEVCNKFFVRIDLLNTHRERVHSFTEEEKKSVKDKPVIAAYFRGSYKVIPSQGCVTRRKTVTILEATQKVGTYTAIFTCYESIMSNGTITGWKNREVGQKFEVTSLRETCSACAIFFNSAQKFIEHMVSKHVDMFNSVFSPDEHYDIFSTRLIHLFNSTHVIRGGGKPAPGEDSSLDILKKLNYVNEEPLDEAVLNVLIIELLDEEMEEVFENPLVEAVNEELLDEDMDVNDEESEDEEMFEDPDNDYNE